VALRREQQAWLEIISVRTEPRGRKVIPITDVTSTAHGREEEKKRW
jgi:hypothetical protein